jgi:MFS family permease
MELAEELKKEFCYYMLGESLFTDTASEMIYPLVPVFVASLGSGAIVLGFIEGIAETTAAMLKLLTGIISDKTGKRKLFVVIGYTLSSFIRPLTGIVSAAWQIVIIRMFDRVGKGIRTSPRDALIASSVDESIRGRSYGFHRARIIPVQFWTGTGTEPFLPFYRNCIKDAEQALRWTFIPP